MEKAVERNIVERVQRAGMQGKFGRILVPTEEVVEVKNGVKRTTERKFFPGYVLVEMVMDDDTWHLVKHTSKVTGFVGGARNRPAPISEDEVMKIVNQMQEGSDRPKHKVEFGTRQLRRPRPTWRARQHGHRPAAWSAPSDDRQTRLCRPHRGKAAAPLGTGTARG